MGVSQLSALQVLLLGFALLLLLQAPSCEAGRKKKKCKSVTPVCQSDRFDVVFSHYDDDHCKVYKCQCRLPEAVVCANGRSKLKADSYGCQYYECITCSQMQPICTGTQVSVFKGDDANGCPQYACECPPNPSRPVCNSNEQIQSGTDSSGCLYYFCNQVRAQCPDKPTCSPNQVLVAAGFVGECELFKCECVTQPKPSCPAGSQARQQDDGMGCPEYRCVENRSPCPPEPVCPSPHQVVAHDGMDENNCVKYVCKCIPLAPITCPDGYRMELETDEVCGCQYYKCKPNCEPKPVCPSVYQQAVVTATRSNGCPSYSCDCKEPEVIQCADPNDVLQLTVASDGSNCEKYVCRNGDTRSNCPMPTCSNPITTGQLDSRGCPIYQCGGGGNCPLPSCSPGLEPTITGYSNNCPQYTCQSSRSSCVSQSCPSGQSSYQVGFSAPNCPYYVCQPTICPAPNSCGVLQRPVLSSDARGCIVVTCENNNGGLCTGVVRQCTNGETLRYVGDDANGCAEYICFRQGCPQPPMCTVGERLVETGRQGLCATYSCQSTNRNCAPMPTCGLGVQPTFTGYDSNSCPVYTCNGARNGGSNCIVPNCQPPLVPMALGSDAFGCPTYMCSPSNVGGLNSGTRNVFGGASCPAPPVCSGGTLQSIGMDANGCTLYSCSGSGLSGVGVGVGVIGAGFSRNSGSVVGGVIGGVVGGVVGMSSMATSCPTQPECLYQEFRVRQQQQVGNLVCTVYTCVNLGDYTGSPRKCLDNPSYCDITQTIETYIDRQDDGDYGYKYKYKRGKKCQRVECKGSSTYGTHY